MAQASIQFDLDDATIEKIASVVVARFVAASNGSQYVPAVATESNYPSPDTQTTWSNQVPQTTPSPPQNGADAAVPSWGAPPAPSPASAPAPAAPPQAPPSAPTASPTATEGPPVCKHGPMRYVPPGVAKSGPRAGQSYPHFWGCPADRNDPTKCKSVPIQ